MFYIILGADYLMLIDMESEKIAVFSIKIIIGTLGFNILVNVLKIIMKVLQAIKNKINAPKMKIRPTVSGTESIQIGKMFN